MRDARVLLCVSTLACGSRDVSIIPPGGGASLVVVAESNTQAGPLIRAWAFDRADAWSLDLEADPEATNLTVATYDRPLVALGLADGSLVPASTSFARGLPLDALDFHLAQASSAEWALSEGPSAAFLAFRLAYSVEACVAIGGCVLDDPGRCDLPCLAPPDPSPPIHGAVIDDSFAPDPPAPRALGCPQFWIRDPIAGYCLPPWPDPTACPPGEGQFWAEVGCRPVDAPCAPGPFPSDLPSGLAFYVRQGATGGDGSMAMPFGDLDEALSLGPNGIVVALTDGDYQLPPGALPQFVIIGRCPSRVRIDTSLATPQTVYQRFAQVTLGAGQLVYDAGGVELDRAHVEGTSISGGTITVDGALLERQVEADRIIIRDSSMRGDASARADRSLVVEETLLHRACGLSGATVDLRDVVFFAGEALPADCTNSGIVGTTSLQLDRVGLYRARPIGITLGAGATTVMSDVYCEDCGTNAMSLESQASGTITRLHGTSERIWLVSSASLSITDGFLASATVESGARLDLTRVATHGLFVFGATLAVSDLDMQATTEIGLLCDRHSICRGERARIDAATVGIAVADGSVVSFTDLELRGGLNPGARVVEANLSLSRLVLVQTATTPGTPIGVDVTGLDSRLALTTAKAVDFHGTVLKLAYEARGLLQDLYFARVTSALFVDQRAEVELRGVHIQDVGADVCPPPNAILADGYSRLELTDLVLERAQGLGLAFGSQSFAKLSDVTLLGLTNTGILGRDSDVTGDRVRVEGARGAALMARRSNGRIDLNDLTLVGGGDLVAGCSSPIASTAFYVDTLGSIAVRTFWARAFQLGAQTGDTSGQVELDRGRFSDLDALLGPTWEGFNEASMIHHVVLEDVRAYRAP